MTASATQVTLVMASLAVEVYAFVKINTVMVNINPEKKHNFHDRFSYGLGKRL